MSHARATAEIGASEIAVTAVPFTDLPAGFD
jgi:hypothetical protein